MILKGPFRGLQENFTGYFTPLPPETERKKIALEIMHTLGISTQHRKSHLKERNITFTLQGKLYFENFALDHHLTGYVRYITAPQISYRIDFKGYDGDIYHLNLKKSLKLTTPLKSFSTLEGILTQERSQKIVGSIVVENRGLTLKKLVQSIF